MANQTVIYNTNMDAARYLGLANGDNYLISAAGFPRAICDSDSKWGQQGAVLGDVDVTEGVWLIDGSKVWWVAFDASSGTAGTLTTIPSIDGITSSGSYLTITTSAAHGFVANDVVEIQDSLSSSANGTWTVYDAPTATTFRVASALSVSVANGGSVIKYDVTLGGTPVAQYLGVWASLGAAAPTVNPAAMPGTGYLKFRKVKAGTTFADNDVVTLPGGATATLSEAGKRGWVHIVMEDGNNSAVSRGSAWNITGDWFELGTVASTTGQTFQHPVADKIPAAWVETGVGTGVYEIYHNAGSGWSTTYIATDKRGKFFTCDTAGLMTFATATIGFPLVVGARVRVPNIHISCTTDFTNYTMNATPASRWEVTLSGDVSWSKMSGSFFVNGAAYSMSAEYCALFDSMIISGNVRPTSLTEFAMSPSSNIDVTYQYNFTALQNGLTLTRCSAAQFNGYRVCYLLSDCRTVQMTDCISYNLTRTTANARSISASGRDHTYTRHTSIGAGSMIGADNSTVTDYSFADKSVGTSNNTNAIDILFITCSDFLVDGVSLYVANNAPANYIFNCQGARNGKIRNVGTRAVPFDHNFYGAFFAATGTTSHTIHVSRCYTVNYINSTSYTVYASSTLFHGTFDNVWMDYQGAYNSNMGFIGRDCTYRGCSFGRAQAFSSAKGYIHTTLAGFDGTHFYDAFASATSGHVGIFFLQKTNDEPSASSYEIIAGTPWFGSSGDVYLKTSGDAVVWTWPHYVLGHEAFSTLAPVINGTITSLDLYYDIDKNDGAGFSGSYKNMYYGRTGGGGTSGLFVITMTSTTGVAVGDYVWGTNVGTSAKVVTVDSGTQVTVNVANAGTVSGTLRFGKHPGETLSPSDGFKLKVKAVTTANGSSTLNGFLLKTTTSANSIDNNLYPLNTVPLTVTVIDSALDPVAGAYVYIEAASGGGLPYNASVTITRSGTVATVTHTAHGLLSQSKVKIKGANQYQYNGLKTITKTGADTYTFDIVSDPGTDATGTIVATAVVLADTTDVNGIVTVAEVAIDADQPIVGKVRKSTSAPYYKSALITGTLDVSDGASLSTVLTLDS